MASLYKMALILDELTIDSPSIAVTRSAPNRFSFSDIIETLAKKPKSEKKRGVPIINQQHNHTQWSSRIR